MTVRNFPIRQCVTPLWLALMMIAVSGAAAAPQAEDESSPPALVESSQSFSVPAEKVQSLLKQEKFLERKIAVRQKNAQKRNDASAQQYNLGYQDGYNKALLDLLKSQLLNGIELPNSGQAASAPASATASMPAVLPPISRPAPSPGAANIAAQPGVATPLSNRGQSTSQQSMSQSAMSQQNLPAASANTAPTTQAPASAASLPSMSTSPSLVAPAAAAALAGSASGHAATSSAPAAASGNSSSNNVFPAKSVPLAKNATANSMTQTPLRQPINAALPQNGVSQAGAASTSVPKAKNEFDQLMSLSTQALQNKHWQQASEYASRAISIKNDVASSYINRSWALAELGDTRQALVDANLAIQLAPNLGLAYNNRAYTYELMDNLPEARNDYQRACQHGFSVACSVLPKVDQVLMQRTTVKREKVRELVRQNEELIRIRDWPQVIAVSTKILELDPNYVSAYVNRSWARAESGKLEASLADAGKAIIINPKDPIAYNNRAYTYELMNDLQSARRDYAKACELKLASACKVVDKIDQIQLKNRVATTQPTAAAPVTRSSKPASKQEQVKQLITASFEKFREGNWGAVESLSNKILKIDPNNALAYVNRAGARTEMGLVYNALDDIEKAIRLNPKLGIAYNNKGYTLERMGDKQKAAIQYQKACQLGLQQSCNDFRRLAKSR